MPKVWRDATTQEIGLFATPSTFNTELNSVKTKYQILQCVFVTVLHSVFNVECSVLDVHLLKLLLK